MPVGSGLQIWKVWERRPGALEQDLRKPVWVEAKGCMGLGYPLPHFPTYTDEDVGDRRSLLCVLNCVPLLEIRPSKPSPPVPQNVTVFGGR